MLTETSRGAIEGGLAIEYLDSDDAARPEPRVHAAAGLHASQRVRHLRQPNVNALDPCAEATEGKQQTSSHVLAEGL